MFQTKKNVRGQIADPSMDRHILKKIGFLAAITYINNTEVFVNSSKFIIVF